MRASGSLKAPAATSGIGCAWTMARSPASSCATRAGLIGHCSKRSPRFRCDRSAPYSGLVRPHQLGSGPMSILGRLARPLREAATVEPPGPIDAETTASLASRLEAAAHARLGRSLAIRHVDAGSCGGCEMELRALTNVRPRSGALRASLRHQPTPRRRAAGDRTADPQSRRGTRAGLDGDA